MQTTDGALQLPLPETRPESTWYAVFDLETTGLDPVKSQIIEIGWCAVRDGVAGPLRALLVRCEQPVPSEIERLTGITSSMLQSDGVPLDIALHRFLDETHGLALVGHNVLRFDMAFLEAGCARVGLAAPPRSRYRDTAALYKAHRLGLVPSDRVDHWSFAMDVLARVTPGLRYRLPVCCDTLGIATDGVVQHRAAGDVALTQQLYARLVNRALPAAG